MAWPLQRARQRCARALIRSRVSAVNVPQLASRMDKMLVFHHEPASLTHRD